MAPRGARGDPISCSTGGAKNREISIAPWDLKHQFNGISIGISMGNFSSSSKEWGGWKTDTGKHGFPHEICP